MSATDLTAMALTVEGARIALLQAGPHSGLHGPAASCVDKQLVQVRDFLNEIAERRRARVEGDSQR